MIKQCHKNQVLYSKFQEVSCFINNHGGFVKFYYGVLFLFILKAFYSFSFCYCVKKQTNKQT